MQLRLGLASPLIWSLRVSADDTTHRLQDLQSLALHEEAVRLAKADPALILRAQETVNLEQIRNLKKGVVIGDKNTP